MSGMEGAAFIHVPGIKNQRPSLSVTERPGLNTGTNAPEKSAHEKDKKSGYEKDNSQSDDPGPSARATRPKDRGYFTRKILREEAKGKYHLTDHNAFSRIKRVDITRSHWIHDPNDRDREIVTLHVKGELEAESTRRSFRWMLV